MPRVWRVVKARHSAAAWTGEGARLYGGRWNSKGTAVVYTAGSAALALLEMLVHLDAHAILASYLFADAIFDDTLVQEIDVAALPSNWRSDSPAGALRAIGDAWVASGSTAVLRVPSMLVESESNYLLNPAHPDFAAIRLSALRPLQFDPRLIKGPPPAA